MKISSFYRHSLSRNLSSLTPDDRSKSIFRNVVFGKAQENGVQEVKVVLVLN
jgi:hypothetical protein